MGGQAVPGGWEDWVKMPDLIFSVQTIGLLRHSLNDLIALRNQRDKQIFFFCPDALSGVTQVSTGGKTASYSSFSHGCAICGAGIFRPKLGGIFRPSQSGA